MIRAILAVARLVLAGWLALLAPVAMADTLVDNVNGVTIGSDGKVLRFTGIVFDPQGRITQVLMPKDKRPKRVDYRVDGKGLTMLPGIIDSHVRLMDMAIHNLLGNGKPAPLPPGATLPPPRPEDRDVAFQKLQRLLAARGVTAVADMGTTMEDWQTYRRAGDARTLYIRIAAYAADVPAMALIGGPGPTPWLYDDRLRLNGVFLPVGGGSDDTQLRNLMSRAAIDGFQIAASADSDAAVIGLLGAIDELTETYKGERRWRLEGAQPIGPAALPRLAAHGVIASVRPGAGPGAGVGVGPAALHPVFGQGPATALPGPFTGLVAGGEAALASLTASGAYAAYAEGRFGRLIAGERADFILVDRDPLTATVEEIRSTRVLQTWINGAKIYEEGLETAQKFGATMPGW